MSSTRFPCGTMERRQLVIELTDDQGGGLQLNGIDFVEVLDSAAPNEALRQRILDLAFLKLDGVAALGPEHFRIDGGTRVTGIEVTGVQGGSGPDRLRLILNTAGDYSEYVLSLVAGPGQDTPPSPMDAPLSQVAFRFKVECPSDFDCVRPDADQPALPDDGLPSPDTLTRDYVGFRRLMLDRMRVAIPGWREDSPADIGVTIVEALAHAADRVSWMQDAVGTEAYFGAARLRTSLRRHARLLGYRPDMGSNARTAVVVRAKFDTGTEAAPVVPIGTRLLSAPSGLRPNPPAIIPRDPVLVEEMIGAGSVVFETMADLPRLRVSQNRIPIHDWGESGCCLPVGTTSADLVGSPAHLDLSAGDWVVFEERIPPAGGPADAPDRDNRQLVRLVAAPEPVTDPVFKLDLTRIRWAEADALIRPLPIGAINGQPRAAALGNVVLADEGRTLDFSTPRGAAGEDAFALGPETRTGVAPDDGVGAARRLRVDVESLVHASSLAPNTPGASALANHHGATAPALALAGDAQDWEAQPDLLASDRFAPHLVVEPGDRGGVYARFGDNALGRAPARLDGFRARVRQGGGPRGNIGADALVHIITDSGDAIESLRNPLQARGGRPAEAWRAVRREAPQAFHKPARAVTAQDYSDAAAEHPEVVRAFARRRWFGSWHVVTLAIDRRGGGPVDTALETDIRRFLESRRLAGHDVAITTPAFVPLDLRFHVCAKLIADIGVLAQALDTLFSARDGGLFHPDALDFGADVALSPLIAAAMRIPGVAWIGVFDAERTRRGHFRRLDRPGIDYDAAGAIPIDEGEIAQLDNDPNFPDRGTVSFDFDGGRRG